MVSGAPYAIEFEDIGAKNKEELHMTRAMLVENLTSQSLNSITQKQTLPKNEGRKDESSGRAKTTKVVKVFYLPMMSIVTWYLVLIR